jgi:hypothetical protein
MERLITDFCFLPAYQDECTGETHLPLAHDGSIASRHTMHGIPNHWVLARDTRGQPAALRSNIIAGFIRGGRFYTPQELARISFDA